MQSVHRSIDQETDLLHDAIIVGGSYAGLSAALMLARARRRVLVIDAGQPRNRHSAHAHGVLAQDGRPGAEILAEGCAQLLRYPTVTWRNAAATHAEGDDGDFRVRTADGSEHRARKLLLATGLVDAMPAVPGAAERWGRTVLHCPYCHGYEMSPGPFGVLVHSPMVGHYASMIADWGDVTLFTDGAPNPDPDLLAARGVRVETAPVLGLEGEGTALDGMRLRDGRLVPLRAIFMPGALSPAGPLVQALGCELQEIPLGHIVRTNEQKLTSRPGVHAAGDAAIMRSNIVLACADGVLAGVSLHQSLIADAISAAGSATLSPPAPATPAPAATPSRA